MVKGAFHEQLGICSVAHIHVSLWQLQSYLKLSGVELKPFLPRTLPALAPRTLQHHRWLASGIFDMLKPCSSIHPWIQSRNAWLRIEGGAGFILCQAKGPSSMNLPGMRTPLRVAFGLYASGLQGTGGFWGSFWLALSKACPKQ